MVSCLALDMIKGIWGRGGDGDLLPLSASPVMPALFDPQMQFYGHCCGCCQYQHVHARLDKSANQAPILWSVPCAKLTPCNCIHVGTVFQVCQASLDCRFCSVSLAYERCSQKAADTGSSEHMTSYHAEKHLLELMRPKAETGSS